MTSELQALSDEELARQSRTGSLFAFEELVHRYERRIYAFVAQSCRVGADAAEVTQDTFVRAFQAIEQFDPRRPFAAWLFAIARRRAIDRFRAATPEMPLETPPDLPDADDPAELLARREERRELWSLAQRRLPAIQFDALWLYYAEDMDVAAIAQVLRRSRAHVKVLLFRARRALARDLRSAQGRDVPDDGRGLPLPARDASVPLKRPGPIAV